MNLTMVTTPHTALIPAILLIDRNAACCSAGASKDSKIVF